MNPIFQLSTRKYEQELTLVKKAMDELEITCKVKNAYELSEPFSKGGWTFFNIQLNLEIFSIIEKSGMMKGSSGFGMGEQFMNFLGHYFESKGSQVRIKQINY